MGKRLKRQSPNLSNPTQNLLKHPQSVQVTTKESNRRFSSQISTNKTQPSWSKFTAKSYSKCNCICRPIRTSWAQCYAENFNKFWTKSFNHWSTILRNLWVSFKSIFKNGWPNSFKNSLMLQWCKKKKKSEPLRMCVKRSQKSLENSCTNSITVTPSSTIWDSEELTLTINLAGLFGMLTTWVGLGMVKPQNLATTKAETTLRPIADRSPATSRMNQTILAKSPRTILSFENTRTNKRKSLLSLRRKRHWQKETI